MQQEYSPYKIVHHPDKLIQLKRGEQTTPLQVQIVPTNRCNQNCSFCAYRMDGYLSNEKFEDKNSLSLDKIIECLDDFVNMSIEAVHYTGGGEPLVHKDIKEIFKETLNRKIDMALVTNGQNLNEEICELLSESSWVRISVDSIDDLMYGMMRNTSILILEKVMKNIRLLVKHKKENIIGVGFVVGKDNYKDVVKAAKIFKDMGVDNFRISATFTPRGYKYFDGFKDEAIALCKQAEELSDNNFKVFNMFNDRIGDLFNGSQDYDFCPFKELGTYIGADYNVYTCCTLAYNSKGLIGSITDQSFKQLWNSIEKENKFSNHNPSKHCLFPCMYESKNKFINYCIQDDPKHVNYI